MKNTALIAAGVLGFLGVALGAFGAHALEEVLKANAREETWDTAVFYHMIHAALLGVIGALANRANEGKWLKFATIATIVGIFIFSGSLYLLSLTNMKWLGAITPLGGLSFMAAWILLIIHATKNNI
jgi:uncharacterized membrane protein YgdD (TMEM256/DUF423 family)